MLYAISQETFQWLTLLGIGLLIILALAWPRFRP